MSTIKNPTRFAELEYCLQGYFDGKLVPVMKQVRDDLTHKQLEERGRYQSSLAGYTLSLHDALPMIGRASCRERVYARML